jgi:hypothetical protein
VIRTAIKTTAVAATIGGAMFLASPAYAGIDNDGSASHDTTNVTVIGGYGVTCTSVAVAGNSGMNCSHNRVFNDFD